MELDVSPVKKMPNKENGSSKETKSSNISSSVSNVAIDQSGLQSLLPRCMQGRFADKSLESLYQIYFKRQKRDALLVMLALAMLFDITVIIIYSINFDEQKIVTICVSSLAMLCEIILLVLCKLNMFSEATFNVLPVILWLIFGLQIYIDLGFEGRPMSPADSVSWQTFHVYASYVMLPIYLRWCFVLSMSSCLLHTLIVSLVWNASSDNLFQIGNQLAANILLYACAHILGCITYYFADRKQRKAFLETKASLATKVVMEKEYKQQERLLLSVLPKHVAEEMIKDIGELEAGQFRKIYMSRHENVSILFADIVGFTAISSMCTAPELVRVLNDLFASFDQLSTKYHQLRIKILGDCYYCICGAPEHRPDHAVLSIHMGLAMVDVIRAVSEKRKADVNMRVGIHTGAVLGGVLGQRQWQFDVLGKEVTLANKMESGGVAGRVHISQSTKQGLSDEFDLEDGKGEDREDALRLSGIKTYLVKSVLKPYPKNTLDDVDDQCDSLLDISKRANQNEEAATDEQETSESMDTTDINGAQMSDDFQKRLRQAIVERENNGFSTNKFEMVTMRFRDRSREQKYAQKKEFYSGISMLGMLFVLIFCFLAQMCVAPRWAYRYIMFALSCLLVAVLSVITLAMNYESVFPKFLVRFSHWMEGSFWFRTLWTILIVLPVMTAEFIDMIGCDPLASSDISNITIPRPLDPMSTRCLYPTYYTHFHILALIGITVLVPIDHMAKMITMTVMTAAHCVLLTLVFPKIFKQYDVILFSNSLGHHTIETKFFLCGLAATITVALFFFNQHIEMMSRKLFLWNEEADEQKMQVERLRSKNQTLLYNLLPVHVAREFIGVRKKDDDLYSHSYDEVGTMFAACPNYNDFYTENAVNNNGLECLRFLNEIISDYDELLHDPRFSSITKIKTVGPTYMAASGMSEDKISSKTKSITDRWQHLDDLVQFAFAMRDALNKINSQSFNNFILRIGINHGPIVAGVIGVRKPHYDIWGNTVNVSSRMESTGQVGKIQIVEETMLILKEFGYTFEKRGLVKIKGKGELLTYFLKDKSEGDYAMPNQVAPF